MEELFAMRAPCRIRTLTLSLSAMLLAPVAGAEGPGIFSHGSHSLLGMVVSAPAAPASMPAPGGPLLRGIGPGTGPWEVATGAQTGDIPFFSLRSSQADAFPAFRTPSGDFQSPVYLLAAFGLQRFSFRVSSWRRLGPGPSVHASTFSVVRNLGSFPTWADSGLGLSMTMYRLGARFEPLYRKRPVSIHLLFRIRFGA